MIDTKLSLSILLPGGTMYSKEESFKNSTKTIDGKENIDFRKFDSFSLKVWGENKKLETIKVFTRKSKPAKQVINMTEEAYNYFISQERPENYRQELGPWGKLTPKQRLNWHCANIANSLGGVLDSWEILK